MNFKATKVSILTYVDLIVYVVYHVYMAQIQYTIRSIPPAIDRVIKKRAKQTGRSFNQTVIDLLALQTLGTTTLPVNDNFDWLYGADTLDESFDKEIKELSKIDEKLWQ